MFKVGGDDHGARVLRHMRHFFSPNSYELWLVLNGNRPFTDTEEGALRLMDEVQEAAGLSLTGLVGNTHLMEHTTPETILTGLQLLERVSHATGLPVISGPVEGTSLGNIMVQAIAKGIITSLAEIRQVIARSFEFKSFIPENISDWDTNYSRFLDVCERMKL